MLYKTRWLFDLDTARMLYCALIAPHFDLGNMVYTVAAQNQLNRLQVIQNAAAWPIMLVDARCPTYDLHEWLKWDTLSTRASKAMVCVIYNCLHNESPPYLFDCLNPVQYAGMRTGATEAGSLQ